MSLFYRVRDVARRWSAWCMAAAAALLTVTQAAPDLLLQVWSLIPDPVKARMPDDLVQQVSLALLGLGMVSQAVKQAEVAAAIERLRLWLKHMGAGESGKVKTKYAAGAGLIALVGTLAAGLLMDTVPEHEGVVLKGYRDPVGIPTKCMGDTTDVVVGKVYTDEQCRVSLDKQLMAHAAPVLRCTPGTRDRPYVLAAAVDLAYNIGTAAYCNSTTAKRFNAGRWAEGCVAMEAWVYAKGRKLPGLVKRRAANRALCLRGV